MKTLVLLSLLAVASVASADTPPTLSSVFGGSKFSVGEFVRHGDVSLIVNYDLVSTLPFTKAKAHFWNDTAVSVGAFLGYGVDGDKGVSGLSLTVKKSVGGGFAYVGAGNLLNLNSWTVKDIRPDRFGVVLGFGIGF